MVKKIIYYIIIVAISAVAIWGWSNYYNANRCMATDSQTIRIQRDNIKQLNASFAELKRFSESRESTIKQLAASNSELERINTERSANINRLTAIISEYKNNQRQLKKIINEVNNKNGLNLDSNINN